MGDCLQVIGEIERCQTLSREYLCLLNPELSPFSTGLGGQKQLIASLAKLANFREKLAKNFLKNLPYPEADILSGIVLGSKQDLGPDLYSDLKSTGTLHVVVASGYNLTVIGRQPVEVFAHLLGRKTALFLGLGLVWGYAGMVGLEAPIVRAAIMLSFLFLAQLLGRKFDQYRAVVGAVWLMLMVKPDLVISVSFQLSIAALLGLMFGGRLFTRVARIPWIGGSLAETLSAQLMVFPIIAYHFGTISWLSPLVNVLILPIVPLIMGVGLLGLLLSWVPGVGKLIIWASFPFLAWMVRVIDFFARLPGIELPLSFGLWQVVFAYLLIFYLLIRKKNGKSS
ncbi:MAG: ComEC/Rec2 family competence protein [Patescibacteria group bacterium]